MDRALLTFSAANGIFCAEKYVFDLDQFGFIPLKKENGKFLQEKDLTTKEFQQTAFKSLNAQKQFSEQQKALDFKAESLFSRAFLCNAFERTFGSGPIKKKNPEGFFFFSYSNE